jgi:hypothetical protein
MSAWAPIPGPYDCGDLVAGLFRTNGPGGTGLMPGAVSGRLTGADAAGKEHAVGEHLARGRGRR